MSEKLPFILGFFMAMFLPPPLSPFPELALILAEFLTACFLHVSFLPCILLPFILPEASPNLEHDCGFQQWATFPVCLPLTFAVFLY